MGTSGAQEEGLCATQGHTEQGPRGCEVQFGLGNIETGSVREAAFLPLDVGLSPIR